jgi:hypothetical protein
MSTAQSTRTASARSVVGSSLDGLPLKTRWELVGLWVATELYSPQRLPLRIVEAIGDSAMDCIRQLRERGLDPRRFEFEPVPQPYRP